MEGEKEIQALYVFKNDGEAGQEHDEKINMMCEIIIPSEAQPIPINRKPCVVFIDEYGLIVNEKNSTYKVELQGSYKWSYLCNCYVYEIKTIEPNIPLSRLFSSEMLFENE